MRLIGINGLKTAGKDTTYLTIKRLVEDAYPERDPEGRVERRAFADNLKIMAMLALGYDGTDEELISSADRLKAAGGIETQVPDTRPNTYHVSNINGRTYLQRFGEHARHVFGDTFWVDQVLPETGIADYDWLPIWGSVGRKGPEVGLPALGCVTDVRYPNEAERTLALKGIVLEVVRPGLESDGHSTEKPLPRELVSYTLVNDGTLEDLADKVALFLDRTYPELEAA